MRRLVVSVIVASGLVMTAAGTAHAEPAPTAGSAQAAGKKMCKVTDPLLDEISGLVATGDGYAVVDDSASQDSHKRVFFLGKDCEITDRVQYTGRGPRDTEDMILSADRETLWIADIGDNRSASLDESRPTISLWSMPADGSARPQIHRLSYPAGDKHDAEALLLNGDGTPVIVTKSASGPAGIYVPSAPLKTDNDQGVPLRKAGEVTVPDSTTSGTPFARLARGMITGGAVSPDGKRVVLRTYLDALEFDVTDGDVLAALKGKPRVTPLPDEPFGEAITYSADGKYFYTVSDMQGETDGTDANYILRYTPVTKVVAAKAKTTAAAKEDSAPSWFSGLGLDDITRLVAGVGVLGLVLVGLGVFGIMRARRKPPTSPATRARDGGPKGPKPSDAETELIGVGAPPPGPISGRSANGGGVYGGGGRPGAGMYGGGSGPKKPSGTGVYGGAAAQPAGRGGAAGRPSGGQPAGRPGQPSGRPGGGQPAGRPGSGGQPAGRPGAGGQPSGRPGAGGQPSGRPGVSGTGRPGDGGQPVNRPGQPDGRPSAPGGQQPGRSGPVARPGAGGGQQPGGRPGAGGGQQRGGSGVYGVPPPPPPPPPGRGDGRQAGMFAGHGDGARQANLNAPGYDYDNPGRGR